MKNQLQKPHLLSSFIVTFLLSFAPAFAQAPQKLNYQMVIRNSSGILLPAGSSIGARISILEGSETGTAKYVERHTVTTNANGLASFEIGGGSLISGNWTSITWSTHTYWIKTEIDPTGGSAYSITGTNQLLSVPYALNSKLADAATTLVGGVPSSWTASGTNIYNNNTGKVGVGTSTPASKLDVEGGITVGASYSGTTAAPTNGAIIQGSVGIGTITPASKLDVEGSISIGTGYSGTSAAPSNGAIIQGNVGIGTSTPSAKLQVTSGGSAFPDLNGLYIYNPTNSANQYSIICARVAGPAAGDPYLSFDVSGEAGWSIGIDNDDNNKLKFSNNWAGFDPNTKMTLTSDGYLGIGTTTPGYTVDASGSTGRTGSFINSSSTDYYGVFGSCNNIPYYGLGVVGEGGFMGVKGTATLSGNGTRYGVYGIAGGGSANYGVYASGDFSCSGTKAATVKTAHGPRELYSQESPELWFEDFGSGTMQNGTCTVLLRDDFSETVTVNEQHPLHAFVTPNGNMGNWWVEKHDDGFIVKAPQCADGTSFDFRVVAKRKGYEELRMKIVTSSYGDKFLYPSLNDVPAAYQAEWVKLNGSKK